MKVETILSSPRFRDYYSINPVGGMTVNYPCHNSYFHSYLVVIGPTDEVRRLHNL